jgi:hypothetical protein
MADTPALDDAHRRPADASDDLVEAVGKVSEAREWVERARGHLYELHQMMGHADLLFGEAADALDEAGAASQAEHLRTEIVGRNIIEGRWTFQLVEEFDDGYYAAVRAADDMVRDQLMEGRRHVFEAEMKERRRTKGHPAHRATP